MAGVITEGGFINEHDAINGIAGYVMKKNRW